MISYCSRYTLGSAQPVVGKKERKEEKKEENKNLFCIDTVWELLLASGRLRVTRRRQISIKVRWFMTTCFSNLAAARLPHHEKLNSEVCWCWLWSRPGSLVFGRPADARRSGSKPAPTCISAGRGFPLAARFLLLKWRRAPSAAVSQPWVVTAEGGQGGPHKDKLRCEFWRVWWDVSLQWRHCWTFFFFLLFSHSP